MVGGINSPLAGSIEERPCSNGLTAVSTSARFWARSLGASLHWRMIMKKMLALVSLLVMGLLIGCGETPKVVKPDPVVNTDKMKEAADEILDTATKEAKGAAEGAKEAVKEATEGAKEEIKEATEGAKEAVKEAKEAAEGAVKEAAGDK